MTHTGGRVCVGGAAVSHDCMCVSPVCQQPYCRVAATVSGSVVIHNLTSENANYERNSPFGVDWSIKLIVPLDSVRWSFKCCMEMCSSPSDNVGKLCFLRLLWLLNNHHLYVCSGAKRCNPNSAAGTICWKKLECQGEAGLRLCTKCSIEGVYCREISWSIDWLRAFFVLWRCWCSAFYIPILSSISIESRTRSGLVNIDKTV